MKNYFKNIWIAFYTIGVGMYATFRHLFVKAVTIQYPEVKVKLTDRARNRLYVNMDDCIGCDQCAKACPVNCITIETVKSVPGDELGPTSTGHVKRLWVTQFDIDIAKCCYCSLCVYPCPTECIKMTDVYEFSEFERHNLIYNFSVMTPGEVEAVNSKYEKWEQDKAAEKAAAAAKKKEAEGKTKDKDQKTDEAPKSGSSGDTKTEN
jgi:NADH-quinone oxidoreductase subunit I